jgi:hypothetical protein
MMLVCAAGSAYAAEYHSDFVPRPGSARALNKERVVDVAHFWAVNAPPLYYKTHGEWPGSWAEVVASGIVTVQLRSVHGKLINPDDGSLDFVGDLQYVFQGSQTPPMIASLKQGGGVRQTRLGEAGTPKHLSQRWETVPAGVSDTRWAASGLPALGRDQRRYQQISVLGAYHAAIKLYLGIHGTYCDWQTLQSSGLGPHAPGTINPLTGVPWKGDGSPNDLLLRSSTDGSWPDGSPRVVSSGGSYILLITDDRGDTPWIFS